MECQILLDTGASKLFMSRSHYLWCKTLYSLEFKVYQFVIAPTSTLALVVLYKHSIKIGKA